MGKNGKRPKSYYIRCAKKQKTQNSKYLGTNEKGFLCTCNDREKDCVNEAYNLLNEYADQLYGKEDFTKIEEWDAEMKNKMEAQEGKESCSSETNTGDKDTKSKQSDNNESKKTNSEESGESEDEGEIDIEAAIAADVTNLMQQNQKSKKISGISSTPRPKRRFHQIRSGANNCIFIGTTLEDPLELSKKIMNDIFEKQQQRTRRLIRMLPVHNTCKAIKENIEKALRELAEKYLTGTNQRYCIVYRVRNNHSLNRNEILQGLCKVIGEVAPDCEADVKTPEVAVNIEIIKTICCISVLPEYFSKYSKYNLEILANKSKRELEDKSESKEKLDKQKTDTVDTNVSNKKENGNDHTIVDKENESTENMENENECKNDNENDTVNKKENENGSKVDDESDSVNEKENLSVHDKEN